MTHSGPVGGPASAAAAGMVAETSGSPMPTASKASFWVQRCNMATGVCQAELIAVVQDFEKYVLSYLSAHFAA